MTRPFTRWLPSVLAAVLAIAPGAYAQTAPGPELPTNPAVDLLFTPVVPCRIVDTRLAGGPIGAGTTRDFAVAGAAGFAGQGGNAAGCGIPLGASAAVINYVAVGPAGPGNLRVTPSGTPVPLASIINYATVSGLNIANGIATPLSTGAAPHITIQADVSATDLVADVLGYYNAASCQAGTVKALGQCYEVAFRPFLTALAAGDACRTAGGRLPAPLELRSLRGGNPLTLEFAGEWTDSIFSTDNVTFVVMIVADNGQVLGSNATGTRPFRCVFHPLP